MHLLIRTHTHTRSYALALEIMYRQLTDVDVEEPPPHAGSSSTHDWPRLPTMIRRPAMIRGTTLTNARQRQQHLLRSNASVPYQRDGSAAASSSTALHTHARYGSAYRG